MTTALTLIEARKAGMIGPENTLLEVFDQEHPIWPYIKFLPASEGGYSFTREQTLASTAVRGINEGYTADLGVLNPLRENMAIVGGDIFVDNKLIRDYGEGIVSVHQAMKAKHLSHKSGDLFFNGNSISNVKEFDGLKARVPLTTSAAASGQLVSEGNSSGGDALQAATLDIAMKSIRGSNQAWLMTRAMCNVINAGARSTSVLGYVERTLDDVGRPVTKYNGIPIVEIDPVGGVYTSIASDETDGLGAGTACQSIFLASFTTTGVHGIWNGPPTVNMQVPTSSPGRLARIEGDIGMAIKDPYSVVRIAHILVTAAMTA